MKKRRRGEQRRKNKISRKAATFCPQMKYGPAGPHLLNAEIKGGEEMSGSAPQLRTGEVIAATNGEQYYVIGKDRIKITEHFPASGKPIEELITDLITHKIKEKVRETV